MEVFTRFVREQLQTRLVQIKANIEEVASKTKTLNNVNVNLHSVSVSNNNNNNPPRLPQHAVVRRADQLGQRETDWLRRRRQRSAEAIQKLLLKEKEKRKVKVNPEHAPVVAIAASGGGARAMVATAAQLTALHNCGLLDATTYLAGVSGSTWAMANLYNSPERMPNDALQSIRSTLAKPLINPIPIPLVDTDSTPKVALATAIERLKTAKTKVNLVDLFGVLLTAAFLETSPGPSGIPKISDQASGHFEDARLPFPLYCAVSNTPLLHNHSLQSSSSSSSSDPLIRKEHSLKARLDQSLKSHSFQTLSNSLSKREHSNPIDSSLQHSPSTSSSVSPSSSQSSSIGPHCSTCPEMYQWVEFSPYEMGLISAHNLEQGVWIPTSAFGRSFYNGTTTSNDPEVAFGIMLGVFGSAFTANLQRILQEISPDLPPEITTHLTQLLSTRLDTTHPLTPSQFPNPAYKLAAFSDPLTNHPTLSLMDSGMDNSIPFAPLLSPARKVDILIILDSSADIGTHPFLARGNRYAERRTGYTLLPDAVAEKHVSSSGEGDGNGVEVVYLPLVGAAAKAWYAKPGNFVWTEGQVDSVAELAAKGVLEAREEIEALILKVWERKRREEKEKEEEEEEQGGKGLK
ncbi:hypothetical protein HDU99_003932 [Rhizoclosmatium hyalinum]|nr:hypothetical protein HDU99_003932 [Rhizoclosmatium hyalinum]